MHQVTGLGVVGRHHAGVGTTAVVQRHHLAQRPEPRRPRLSPRGRIIRPSCDGSHPVPRTQSSDPPRNGGSTSTAPAYSMLTRPLLRRTPLFLPRSARSPHAVPSGLWMTRRTRARDRRIVLAVNEIPFRPVVRTQSDVEQMWRRLMSPLGFTSSLTVDGLDRGRPPTAADHGVHRPACDAPTTRRRGPRRSPRECCHPPDCAVPSSAPAPARGRPDANDLAWARTLYDAGRLARLPPRGHPPRPRPRRRCPWPWTTSSPSPRDPQVGHPLSPRPRAQYLVPHIDRRLGRHLIDGHTTDPRRQPDRAPAPAARSSPAAAAPPPSPTRRSRPRPPAPQLRPRRNVRPQSTSSGGWLQAEKTHGEHRRRRASTSRISTRMQAMREPRSTGCEILHSWRVR